MSNTDAAAELLARFPATLPDSARRGEPDQPEPIAFIPVPRLRRRRNGWSEETQRAFIAALDVCGSVTRAARAVGMTPRSAYRLLDAEGADSFAAAWDQAIEQGRARLRIEALDRALLGALVPVYRRGRLVRVEHRHNDRLAIALFSGREQAVDDYRRTAVSRMEYRRDMRALDERRAEEQRRAEALWAEHQAILDEIEREQAEPKPRGLPRIIAL